MGAARPIIICLHMLGDLERTCRAIARAGRQAGSHKRYDAGQTHTGQELKKLKLHMANIYAYTKIKLQNRTHIYTTVLSFGASCICWEKCTMRRHDSA
jgi:hypothetical protein